MTYDRKNKREIHHKWGKYPWITGLLSRFHGSALTEKKSTQDNLLKCVIHFAIVQKLSQFQSRLKILKTKYCSWYDCMRLWNIHLQAQTNFLTLGIWLVWRQWNLSISIALWALRYIHLIKELSKITIFKELMNGA